MCKILLSINPEYADKIINGTKKYEFRTRVAKRKVDSILIYSTSPIKKVLGEAQVLKVISEHPNKLWKKTNLYAGINKKFFDSYFNNRDLAFAYELGDINIFETPLELSDFGCKTAPQSFMYVNK